MRRTSTSLEPELRIHVAELGAYFAGGHAGDMGLRSWLGSWGDYGPVRGGMSSSVPTGPDGGALAAARAMGAVEEALELIDPANALVLKAYYTPRGPDAWGAHELGALAAIALVLPAPVIAVLQAEGMRTSTDAEERRARAVERLRVELRAGSWESARAELELVPLVVIEPIDAVEWLRALIGGGRDARRILRRIRTASNAALTTAHAAYRAAAALRLTRKRDDRLARHRASLEAR